MTIHTEVGTSTLNRQQFFDRAAANWSIGGAVAHDALPDEEEMHRLLSEAGLQAVELGGRA